MSHSQFVPIVGHPPRRSASAWLVVVLGVAVGGPVGAQERAVPLAGAPVEAAIAGGASHVYRLTSTGNELVHLVVDQKRIDLVVTVTGPGVDERVDSPNGDVGPEPVEVVLESAGTYVVTVATFETDAKEGRYALRVVERRPATVGDRTRLANSPGRPLGELRLAIERTTRSINATWGIYVKCLETGEEIAINADAKMDTMGVMMLPLMIEVFEQVKSGRLRLDDRHTLTAADRRPGSGILERIDPGVALTVKDLVTFMVVGSDNTATDVLYRLVGGPAAVTARMRSYGLTSTITEHPLSTLFERQAAAGGRDEYFRGGPLFTTSTPREIGLLLERMMRGELVESSRMIENLRGLQSNDGIPRFLGRTDVRHKTGGASPYIANDVGVINLPGRTVVISVFTANHFGDYGMLQEAIGRIAERVAAHFTNRR